MGGVLKSVGNTVGSLLGSETPGAPPAPAFLKAAPAAAITTSQPPIASRSKPATGAKPRARGARSASVLTTDLGDAKLGG